MHNRQDLEKQIRSISAKISKLESEEKVAKFLHADSLFKGFLDHTESRIRSLEQLLEQDEQDLDKATAEEEKKNAFVQEQIQIEAARQEKLKEAFQQQNQRLIDHFVSADHYNQQDLHKVNDLLQKDKLYCQAHNIQGSAIKKADLSGLACNLESAKTIGQLSSDEKKLVDTHKTVVEGYLYIIYGQHYSPEQIKKIIEKQPGLIDDAETYFKKRAGELGFNGLSANLCCFRDPSDHDRALEKYIMENLSPQARKNLQDLQNSKDFKNGHYSACDEKQLNDYLKFTSEFRQWYANTYDTSGQKVNNPQQMLPPGQLPDISKTWVDSKSII